MFASTVARNRVPILAASAPACEHGSDASGAADASSGHYRHPYGVDDGVEQGQKPDLTAHVTARFDTLSHHQIATHVDGSLRLAGRSNLPSGQCARVVDQ